MTNPKSQYYQIPNDKSQIPILPNPKYLLLAIDIGNTNINLGVFSGMHLLRRYVIPTKERSYAAALKIIIGKNKIEDTIICSVVPQVETALAGDLRRLQGKPPCIIGKDTGVPIRNLYRKARQVGYDRLVNAYAGVKLYGAPLIVIDFGTAVTFDVVSKAGAYLGGMILPGLRISLSALHQKTALLPEVRLSLPRELIGRDTKDSMLSGIVYGSAAIVSGLTARIKNKIGGSPLIIGTGGDIPLVSRYCRKIDKIDRDLTLKGLNLIYRTF